MTRNKILILGGAGFIGSNIAAKLLNSKQKITVIDGLLRHTGGRKENLEKLTSKINFIPKGIENISNLNKVINDHNIIIDSMGWTSHLSAIDNPSYDAKLNLNSHFHLIKNLKNGRDKLIIYLGSRGQYGKPSVKNIDETTAMNPEDVQGIHKLASENMFRVYSKIYGFNAISLRISNCFGPNQPTRGKDIGLVGGFIKDFLADKKIELYGHNRKRSLVYIDDLAKIISLLITKKWPNFTAINVAGQEIFIADIIKKLHKLTGKGSYQIEPMPAEISKIDIGNATMSQKKLKKLIGAIPNTGLETALAKTINHFRRTSFIHS